MILFDTFTYTQIKLKQFQTNGSKVYLFIKEKYQFGTKPPTFKYTPNANEIGELLEFYINQDFIFSFIIITIVIRL